MRKSFVGWNKADGISCLGCTSRIVCDGITTRYEYDATGRLVREGDRTYTYGYLDKVTSVRDGANTYTYTYHPDGQLATADYGRARTPAAPQGEEYSPSFETFTWDGLALIQRGNEHFINEPHVGGGNPVVSSKGTSYFNDMLGTTVGAKSGKTYSAATLSAFGEDLNHHSSTSTSHFNSFFTGKPEVAGLGHAFFMRNYRAGLGKWQTADPMGYPDGWNQLAYGVNSPATGMDILGCEWITVSRWDVIDEGSWHTISGDPDYKAMWDLSVRYGISGWGRTYEDVDGPNIVLNDLVWYIDEEDESYVYHDELYCCVAQKTIERGIIFTKKDFKDPNTLMLLLKAGLEVWTLTKGGNAKSQQLKTDVAIGMAGNDAGDAMSELWKRIQQYGQDDEFKIVFGREVQEKTIYTNYGYIMIYVE